MLCYNYLSIFTLYILICSSFLFFYPPVPPNGGNRKLLKPLKWGKESFSNPPVWRVQIAIGRRLENGVKLLHFLHPKS